MSPCVMKSLTPDPTVTVFVNQQSTSSTSTTRGFSGLKSSDRAAHEEIKHRAYSIWECAGRPPDCEEAHWLAAETEVMGEVE